jgi:hypothetical protein
VSTIADALTELAGQFESLMSGGSGQSSLMRSVFGGGFGWGGNNSSSPLPGPLKQLAGGVLGGPLGMVASVFSSLFRDEPEPLVLPVYERLEALSLDFDIGAAEMVQHNVVRGVATAGEAGVGVPAMREAAATVPTVMIQVNAMDASSFSERRNEIASAVREALTRNHALRDEIWEE